MMGLRNSAGISYLNHGWIYVTPSQVVVWNGTGIVGTQSLSSATWYNAKGTINADGTCTFSYYPWDGTRPDKITGWTEIGSTTVVNTFNYTTNDIYFATNAFTANWDYAIDSFYYTDDGVIAPPRGSLLDRMVIGGKI
jgi:hypothetical protein